MALPAGGGWGLELGWVPCLEYLCRLHVWFEGEAGLVASFTAGDTGCWGRGGRGREGDPRSFEP